MQHVHAHAHAHTRHYMHGSCALGCACHLLACARVCRGCACAVQAAMRQQMHEMQKLLRKQHSPEWWHAGPHAAAAARPRPRSPPAVPSTSPARAAPPLSQPGRPPPQATAEPTAAMEQLERKVAHATRCTRGTHSDRAQGSPASPLLTPSSPPPHPLLALLGGVALATARPCPAGESRAARQPLPRRARPAGGRAKPADGSTLVRESLALPPPAAQRAAASVLWRRQERPRAAARLPQQRRLVAVRPLFGHLIDRQGSRKQTRCYMDGKLSVVYVYSSV